MTALAWSCAALKDDAAYDAYVEDARPAAWHVDVDYHSANKAQFQGHTSEERGLQLQLAHGAAYTMSAEDELFGWCEWERTNWTDVSADAVILQFHGGVAWLAQLYVKTDGSNIGVRLKEVDGADTGIVWADPVFAPANGTKYEPEIRVHYSSATQWEIEARVDGISKVSTTQAIDADDHPAFSMLRAGFMGTVDKGGDVDVFTGDAVVHDSNGAAANSWPYDEGNDGPHIEPLLPDADVAGETDWEDHLGGTGVYTEWDDPIASCDDAATYNVPPTSGAPNTQGSTYPNSADIDSWDDILGVAIRAYVYSTNVGGLIAFFVLDDGTEDEQAMSERSGSVWIPSQRYFITKPSGGAWDLATVNAIEAKTRKKANFAYPYVTWLPLAVYYVNEDEPPPGGANPIFSKDGIHSLVFGRQVVTG